MAPGFSILTLLRSTGITPRLTASFLPIHLPTHRPLCASWYTQFRPPSSIQTQNQLVQPQRFRIVSSAVPAARYSTNYSYSHQFQQESRSLYAVMAHGAGRRSATFFAGTLHSTDRSLPCRHELSIAKDVTLRVSTRRLCNLVTSKRYYTIGRALPQFVHFFFTLASR